MNENQIDCALDGGKLAWLTSGFFAARDGRKFMTMTVWNKNEDTVFDTPVQSCIFLERKERDQLRAILRDYEELDK